MKNRIKELEKLIEEAAKAYYNGTEIISDDEYDALVYELSNLDPKNTLLVKVGAEPTEEWVKEKHPFPLGSLDKVNNPADMVDWIKDKLENKDVLVVEKLDGLSLGCVYENGVLTKALLRGDGFNGENIFLNVLKMKGLVDKLSIPFNGTIRGEILLTKTDHKTHFPDYSNPRNAASGLCRKLENSQTQHLTLMFYDVMGDVDFQTEVEKFKFLADNKFLVPNYKHCKNAQEVNDLWQKYQSTIRNSLDYEIDGLVIYCNDVAFSQELGSTNLRPKGKIAFKFANQFVKTTINNITWTTGNSGRITPICWFDKVNLLGSNIEKASVYNIAYINKVGLGIGADVLVCKAGEIIPRVEKVVKPSIHIATPPSHCPSCNILTTMSGEYLICPNTQGCVNQIVGCIKNWVNELNILELGETLIEKLVANKLVSTPADLYTLTIDQLANLDRMGEKSAKNVYNSLWKVNPINLETFLGGLSIPMIGSSMIKLVIEAGYDTLDKITQLSQQQLEQIKGMGPAKAASLASGLKDKADIIQALLNNGVKIKDKVVGKLTGKSFCFSGSMVNKRPVLEQMVLDNGGTIKSSVGKGLTFLVLASNDSTSSKAIKAKANGTAILSEDDFLKMI